ncbi:MAG: DUF2157 domain-containing protein [Bacteroidota bacterium]
MSMLKELPKLLEAGIITDAVAADIEHYYRQQKKSNSNRLFVAFGILGAILVGLGVILILAHNWDTLPRITKTVIAFLPLLVSQGVCAWALFKKPDSTTWRESGAALLFFAVGSAIALVSQIYNIDGELYEFLFGWLLLCWPIIYVLRSSIASLLFLSGITYYAAESGYWNFPNIEPYWYWIFLALMLPHYYSLFKNQPKSNFLIFHNWMIPLSLTVTLGTVALDNGDLLFWGYMSLFGLFYLIGEKPFFTDQKARNNGFRFIGAIGSICILLFFSFEFYWSELSELDGGIKQFLSGPEVIVTGVLTIVALVLLAQHYNERGDGRIKPFAPVFVLFFITFVIGFFHPIAVVLTNLILLGLGVSTIFQGIKEDHLGILNFGLLIIAALAICRFFDEQLSFVLKGILFLLVGIGFFATNYSMLKNRVHHEA